MTRLWLGVALAVTLTAAGWFGYRAAHRAGYEAGTAAVKAEWHADRARAAEAATEALRAAHAKREEVERDLEAKLGDADRRGRELARRLRHPQACPLPAPAGTPAPADDAPGVPGDPGETGAALAAHLGACERDATRLAELQRWVSP